MFAELLLDLHEMYTPSINIMDAVVGMGGAGPSNGNPRKIGLLLVSKSCTAIDYVAVTIAGFDPMIVPTVKIANERGIGPNSLTEITIFGEILEPLIMKDFKKATTMWLSRAPPFMTNILKTIIAVKPRINAVKCKKCGECFRDCPPQAIRFIKGSAPVIDYKKCMRCYCCQELCPEGAIDISVPLVRKAIKR